MRSLGLETSTRRGSVALVESGRVVVSLAHEEPNRHAERLPQLIDEALASAGWPKESLDRIGVGIGPGSFTGLRVGISLAAGMGLGLDRPVVGIGSLRAMAHCLEADCELRVAVLDARREEFFVAAYSKEGAEELPPRAVPQADLGKLLSSLFGGRGFAVAGEAVPDSLPRYRCTETDLPWAGSVGQLALLLDPPAHPPLAAYVRGANAVVPDLPPSPFATE